MDLDLRQPATPTRAADAVSSPQHPGPSTLSWEAPEYHLQPKTTAWYVGVGVLLALLLFAAFLMRSFLSGVVFALLGLLVLLYSERPPRTARFALSNEGVQVNDRRYPYRELGGFNVVESPTGPLALVRSRRLVMPLLHIPLGEHAAETIRARLRAYLTEDPELRESLADLLAHRLGF